MINISCLVPNGHPLFQTPACFLPVQAIALAKQLIVSNPYTLIHVHCPCPIRSPFSTGRRAVTASWLGTGPVSDREYPSSEASNASPAAPPTAVSGRGGGAHLLREGAQLVQTVAERRVRGPTIGEKRARIMDICECVGNGTHSSF